MLSVGNFLISLFLIIGLFFLFAFLIYIEEYKFSDKNERKVSRKSKN